MMPEGIESCTVTYEVVTASADTPDDADRDPDFAPFGGAVVFRPSIRKLRRMAPTPIDVFLRDVEAYVGDDGILRDLEGNPGVRLISPFSTGIAEKGFTWEASFQLDTFTKISFPFQLQPGETRSLTQLDPVSYSEGVITVQGDPGPPGPGFRYRGAWTSGTYYEAGDVVSANDSTFLVTVAHTSGLLSPLPNDHGPNMAVWAGRGPQGVPGAGAPGATPTALGSIMLKGHLGGTAENPTVPGLATKVDTTDGRLSDARTPTLHTHTKDQVGLANVDNTADSAKPVSTLQAAAIVDAKNRANHTGTQVAATISDLLAVVDAEIGSKVVGGANVIVAYNPETGQTTVSATGGGTNVDVEAVRDTIGAALVAGANIQITVDDVSDSIFIAVTGLTKASVGLENVDNTSDANKPVSAPQLAALNGKVDKSVTEAYVFWTGTTWPARPAGYVRVHFVGGTTRPSSMVANDVWENDL